jgi:hypothetical protein
MEKEKELEISQQLKALDRRASKAESGETKANNSLKAMRSEKEMLERSLCKCHDRQYERAGWSCTLCSCKD